MSELIYVDTNVWLDYLLSREDSLRSLSVFAFELFKKTVDCKYKIILSSWTLKELNYKIASQDLNELLQWLSSKNKLVKVYYSKDDLDQAKKYNPWQDSLHEILAKKSNAKYLVTRNLSDFGNVRNFVQVVLPENL